MLCSELEKAKLVGRTKIVILVVTDWSGTVEHADAERGIDPDIGTTGFISKYLWSLIFLLILIISFLEKNKS
jgi:hypothetical protein